MARVVSQQLFTATERRAVKVPTGAMGAFSKVAVYVQETTGAGSATLAVRGSFSDDASADTTSIQITTATATGSGAVTEITALTDCPFTYIHLVVTNTGASSNTVWVAFV